jgi:hypothetical protein
LLVEILTSYLGRRVFVWNLCEMERYASACIQLRFPKVIHLPPASIFFLDCTFFSFSSQLMSRDWYVLEWSNINEAARVRMSSISCPALAALTVVFELSSWARMDGGRFWIQSYSIVGARLYFDRFEVHNQRP